MRLRSLSLCSIHLEVFLSEGAAGLIITVVSEKQSSFVRFHWRESWGKEGIHPARLRGFLGPGWRDSTLSLCSLREALRSATLVLSAELREEDLSCFEGQLSDPAGLVLALQVMDS